MKKKMSFLLVFLIFAAGVPFVVKAATETDIKSCGNIIYKSNSGSVELYSEDIALLQEKLATVPDEIFDPGQYSGIYKMEYSDISTFKTEDTSRNTIKSGKSSRASVPVASGEEEIGESDDERPSESEETVSDNHMDPEETISDNHTDLEETVSDNHTGGVR